MLPLHRKNHREALLANETVLERFPQPGKNALPIAVCYPAAYRVGMSNLGFHFIYGGLRNSRKLHVERLFSDTSPVTLETGSKVASKAAIFISVSYEEDYINLVRILHDSGIPPLRENRRGRPLVIAGGPAVSANPFPISEVADAIGLGEGEGMLEAIVGVLEEESTAAPAEILRSLARIPGMYLPGLSREGVSFKESALPARFPRSVIIGPESTFPLTLLVESGRGCPGACAFCLATSVYRPFRVMRVAEFEKLLATLQAPVERIGLVSTAVAANPDFPEIIELLASRGISVSLSSLRAEDIDDEKARLVGGIGTASVSLAPESGSEKLRFALGKRVSDEVYFHAAAKLREAGVTHFTLYILTGVPGESEETVAETRAFMEGFRKAIGGRSFSVHVNPVVPKAWTPLQFWAMPDERELAGQQEEIVRALRLVGVAVQTKSVRSAIRQALLSMGDERLGRAIVNHVESGLSWKKALEEAGVNVRFPHQKKGPETSFPWDSISGPVRRETLLKRFEGIEEGSPFGAA